MLNLIWSKMLTDVASDVASDVDSNDVYDVDREPQ